MIKGIFSLFSLLTVISFSSPYSTSMVQWISPTSHDFGTIPYQEPAFFDFTYKNISDQPIIIDNVRTTCGCTAPTWTYDPIPPNAVDTIRIEFDARKSGYFYKKIKVFFHGQRKAEVLFIEGDVEK